MDRGKQEEDTAIVSSLEQVINDLKTSLCNSVPNSLTSAVNHGVAPSKEHSFIEGVFICLHAKYTSHQNILPEKSYLRASF